jgi:hypothetical protein
MRTIKLLAIFIGVFLVGCAGGAFNKFAEAQNETLREVKCSKEPDVCIAEAVEVCAQINLKHNIISSYSKHGSAIFDSLPGYTVWYGLTYSCTELENTTIAWFPFKGMNYKFRKPWPADSYYPIFVPFPK